jgi:phage-related protein
MPGDRKKLVVCFYSTSSGGDPVRDWLLSLDPADRKTIGSDIATVEYGWPVGMPTCRPLGNGLWEVRSHISDGRIARVIFCVADGSLILLHGFIKKTQKTPDDALMIARVRQKDVQK